MSGSVYRSETFVPGHVRVYCAPRATTSRRSPGAAATLSLP